MMSLQHRAHHVTLQNRIAAGYAFFTPSHEVLLVVESPTKEYSPSLDVWRKNCVTCLPERVVTLTWHLDASCGTSVSILFPMAQTWPYNSRADIWHLHESVVGWHIYAPVEWGGGGGQASGSLMVTHVHASAVRRACKLDPLDDDTSVRHVQVNEHTYRNLMLLHSVPVPARRCDVVYLWWYASLELFIIVLYDCLAPPLNMIWIRFLLRCTWDAKKDRPMAMAWELHTLYIYIYIYTLGGPSTCDDLPWTWPGSGGFPYMAGFPMMPRPKQNWG